MPLRRGRPPKTDATLSREAILSAALARLNGPTPRAVSLRQLADDLGVTPMALYSHVDGVDDVLDALAERSFIDFPVNLPQSPAQDLRGHLVWYCTCVLKHPGQTAALVARRGSLPRPHAAWTARLRQIILAAGLSATWSDILVDHLHGFALSRAATGAEAEESVVIYEQQLETLLSAILPTSSQAGA